MNCNICGRKVYLFADNEPESWVACDSCTAKYPPSLLKAVNDPFDYALRLVTGEIIRFERAEVYGDYVTLHGNFEDSSGHGVYTGQSFDLPPDRRLHYPCPRGIDVRIADIVWCADAPTDS